MKKRGHRVRISRFCTSSRFLALACLVCFAGFPGFPGLFPAPFQSFFPNVFSGGLLLRGEAAVLAVGSDEGHYSTLEKALHAAASGDSILLAEGVYTRASGYIIEKNLTLQGPSEGEGILQTSETPGGIPDTSVLTIEEGLRVTLNNLLIRHGNNHNGGGIYLGRDSSLIMKNCTITKNTAFYSGGGIFARDRNTLEMANCTIAHNTAWNDIDTNPCGGGIAAFDSTLRMTNCTVYGNSGAFGGGIYSQPYDTGDLFLQNCTFHANGAEKLGRSLCHHDNYRGAGFVVNSIFWGNSGTAKGEIYAPTPLTIICSVTNLRGEGNTSEDPRLGALENNGGSTPTCALKAGSSALDAGLSVGSHTLGERILTIPGRDQRGAPRPQFDGVDMGAFELGP